MNSLYTELKNAGCKMGNHESDLHVLCTAQAVAIITKPGHAIHAQNVTTFFSNIDGQKWLDIPFAYTPFWEEKERFIDNFYSAKA